MKTQTQTTRRQFLTSSGTLAAAGKSMGNCMATGHAAGIAGAMCAAKQCIPRELKVAELQTALRGDGVRFDLVEREQKGLR